MVSPEWGIGVGHGLTAREMDRPEGVLGASLTWRLAEREQIPRGEGRFAGLWGRIAPSVRQTEETPVTCSPRKAPCPCNIGAGVWLDPIDTVPERMCWVSQTRPVSMGLVKQCSLQSQLLQATARCAVAMPGCPSGLGVGKERFSMGTLYASQGWYLDDRALKGTTDKTLHLPHPCSVLARHPMVPLHSWVPPSWVPATPVHALLSPPHGPFLCSHHPLPPCMPFPKPMA